MSMLQSLKGIRKDELAQFLEVISARCWNHDCGTCPIRTKSKKDDRYICDFSMFLSAEFNRQRWESALQYNGEREVVSGDKLDKILDAIDQMQHDIETLHAMVGCAPYLRAYGADDEEVSD